MLFHLTSHCTNISHHREPASWWFVVASETELRPSLRASGNAMDRQAFDCIRLFASPFSNLEFLWCPPGLHSLLCDPMSDSLRYHYSARKGPRSSNVFHLFERFHNSAEILCVCQISFLLSFLNVHFMAVELNSTLYLFPPQSRNWDPFFSQQSACWSALYLAYNWRVQKFPLGFGHRIVKKCYVVNRGRNQW